MVHWVNQVGYISPFSNHVEWVNHGKSTISMAMFSSYVSLPKAKSIVVGINILAAFEPATFPVLFPSKSRL